MTNPPAEFWDVLVEEDAWDERCPCCELLGWGRLIEAKGTKVYYCVFCRRCGKPIEEKWSDLG